MEWLKTVLLVAGGGAVGSVFRYVFCEFVHLFVNKIFPVGILLTNVLGSLVMGYLAILLFERMPYAADLRSLLLIGFLGGFTTFSTFSLDTVKLLQEGYWMMASFNVILSVILCVGAAGFGAYLADFSIR